MLNLATETIFLKGTFGNLVDPLTTIISFSLLVYPSENNVIGTVKVFPNTAQEAFSGQVSGKIYTFKNNDVKRLISLQGENYSNTKFTPFPFEAILSLDDDWNGKGGFSFEHLQEENINISASSFVLETNND